MSIPQTPSTLAVPAMRHKSYFIHEADVTIRVRRVHTVSSRADHCVSHAGRELHLSGPPILSPTRVGIFPTAAFPIYKLWPRSSRIFRGQSARLGRSNPRRIRLFSVGVLQSVSRRPTLFPSQLTFRSKYSIYNATPEQWSSILELAQKWGFKDVEQLCIRELEKLNLSAVDRIHIYQKHGLDDALLLDSYEILTTRDEPIGVNEGVKLGLRTSLQIAQAREISRGPDTGGGLRSPSAVQLKGPDLRTLISKICELRVQTNGAGDMGPFTAPVHNSGRLDRASALPAVSNADIFHCEVLMALPTTLSRPPPQRHRSRKPFLKARQPPRTTLQQMTPSI